MSLLNVSFVLLLIMDPLGNIPSYLSMVRKIDPKRLKWILMRELLIALILMLGFHYLGEYLFKVLDLSETTVRLTAGTILFLIAIKILFAAPDSIRANLPSEEPVIFPLAVPLIAGPALLATIMLYAHLEPLQSIMVGAILLAWLGTVLILYFAKPIRKILGENGLMACERLIGMILVLLAVQWILEGIVQFWTSHANGHA